MFITCFYAIPDPKSGRLLYADAGHDLPTYTVVECPLGECA